MANLNSLSTSEQTLIWDQGFVNEDHTEANALLSISEALKASGYDFATVLTIMKCIQIRGKLPPYFSIINNEFLVFPDHPQEEAVFNITTGTWLDSVIQTPIRKLMALTFWLAAEI